MKQHSRVEGQRPLFARAFGATDNITLRSFGYITSAARATLGYLPEAQIQIAHTINTGHRVNGTNLERSRSEAIRFAKLGRLLLASTMPKALDRITFLTDPDEAISVDTTQILESLKSCPQSVSERLQNSGERRGGDTIAYVAAHLQMHDTAVQLPRLTKSEPEPIAPQRIISLGAQSERPFYLARMACRDLELTDRLETAQLFTRHILPPYQACHEGEPRMQDVLLAPPLRETLEWAQNPFDTPHPTNSVARDLAYLQDFIQGAPHA